jgi:hypothetical protein
MPDINVFVPHFPPCSFAREAIPPLSMVVEWGYPRNRPLDFSACKLPTVHALHPVATSLLPVFHSEIAGAQVLQSMVRIAVQDDRSANPDSDFGHLALFPFVVRHVALHEFPRRSVDHREGDAYVAVYVDRVPTPMAFERDLDIRSWWLADVCFLWARNREPVQVAAREVYERVDLFRGSLRPQDPTRDVFDERGWSGGTPGVWEDWMLLVNDVLAASLCSAWIWCRLRQNLSEDHGLGRLLAGTR